MFDISGLDDMFRELKEAELAISELDGEIGAVSFDGSNPADIERAIISMEQMVDAKLAQYAHNDLVSQLAEDLKSQFRWQIVDLAAKSRLEGLSNHDRRSV